MNLNKKTKQQLISQIEDQYKTIEELHAKNASLQAAVGALNDKVGQDNQVRVDLEEQIKQLKDDIQRRRGTEHQLTQELQKARNQVTSIRNDAQGMESRIAELSAENNKDKIYKYVAICATIMFIALALICGVCCS